LFYYLDLYHKSMDPGERQYKSKTKKRRFDLTMNAGGRPRGHSSRRCRRSSPPSPPAGPVAARAIGRWGGTFSSSFLLSSLELSDTKVYEPQIRALLGTATQFCEVVVLKLRIILEQTARSFLEEVQTLVAPEPSRRAGGCSFSTATSLQKGGNRLFLVP